MRDDLVKRLRGSCYLDLPEAADVIEDLIQELESIDERYRTAIAELVRLGFDFESIVGRKLKGQEERTND